MKFYVSVGERPGILLSYRWTEALQPGHTTGWTWLAATGVGYSFHGENFFL